MADIETLGASVASLSKIIAERLEAAKFPKPSFGKDTPAVFPPQPEIQEPRLQLVETLTDLLLLATGPGDYHFLHGGLFINHDATILDLLNQFNIYTTVPLEGGATYSEIAKATNIPENLIRRILRYAFTMHIFAPEAPGSERVVHTSFSAHPARIPEVRSWVAHAIEEARPAAVKAPEAIRRFNLGKEEESQDMHETPFGLSWPPLRNGKLADFWSVGVDDPRDAWRVKRFGEAMEASVLSAMVQADDVVGNFDWVSLGEATVVDVGGSDGALGAILARKSDKLNIIVQDLPRVEAEFNANSLITDDIKSRVKFQGQDFFNPQPQNADVFVLKHVLHNWPDKYAVTILKNLVAKLNPGGRIVICDSVVPSDQDSLPLSVRKAIAAADIQMFVMLNATERRTEDWERLLAKADSRLRLAKTTIVPGAIVSLVEVVLDA